MPEIPELAGGLHIVTYDVRGIDLEDGQPKPFRNTGLVEQTHQLIGGLVQLQPDIRLAVTQTSTQDDRVRQIQLPEGPTALWQAIETDFARPAGGSAKSADKHTLIRHYYEDRVHDTDNPLYASLARQYARAVRRADMSNILLQNANPIASLLKTEELGEIDPIIARSLNVVGVAHDIETYERRWQYVIGRLGETAMNAKLVAVSGPVRDKLGDLGAPDGLVTKVCNGLDIEYFEDDMEQARSLELFEAIRRRNGLPIEGDMVMVSARRVSSKGHADVIRAAALLGSTDAGSKLFFAFTGHDMKAVQEPAYEKSLRALVQELGLQQRVFFLDKLTEAETAACYDAAYATVLASTRPEGFAYSNVKSMLAGTPVLTTPHGGPLDYIHHDETGLFIDMHSPESIAEQLLRLKTVPGLYDRIVAAGAEEAHRYSAVNMALGYAAVFAAGGPRLPLRVHARSRFIQIGHGMHTEVFRRQPPTGCVVQIIKPDHMLNIEAIEPEYEYLRRAYAAMPGLVPVQRLVPAAPGMPEDSLVIVKEEIVSDPDRMTLLQVGPDDLERHTLEQLAQFAAITKALMLRPPDDPELAAMGSRAPDIIDVNCRNLVIDPDGNLRLIDTNKLINVAHLQGLAASGEKLDTVQKKIHTKLLRRLMFIDTKFLGRSREDLQADPFYLQYLDPETIGELHDLKEWLPASTRWKRRGDVQPNA